MSKLSGIMKLTSACSALCIGSSLVSGQKIGNPLDFIKGAIGLNQEDYYEGHGTQSGTFMEALGGTTDNLAVAGATGFLKSHSGKKAQLKLAKKIGGKNAVLLGRGLAPALLGWQMLQAGDELIRGDGDPFKDKFDLAGNLFNIAMLGASLKSGNFAGSLKKSAKSLGRIGTKLLQTAA